MSDQGAPRRQNKRINETPKQLAPLATSVGHTRFMVLVGVAAVLLVAAALFVYGAVLAVMTSWNAMQTILAGQSGSTDVTVDLLGVVSVMLKAVVFYLIGVGFYSLFVAPLNLPAALGVETLNDLESKIVSVVIVILAITFLEHFILWQEPVEILQFGVALALVTAALVFFQFHAHLAKQAVTHNAPDIEERAQVQLFREGHEQRDLGYEEEVEEASRPSQRAPTNNEP